MRTITLILILALICISSLARHNRDENRRRFRPSEDDVPEDPNADGNDDPENGEDSWGDDNRPWRRNRRQHNHNRDDTEDGNNEESNVDSNVESNVEPKSSSKSSKAKSSSTKKPTTKTSTAKSAKAQSSGSAAALPGHLQSDTFAGTDYNDDALFKQQCVDIHNDERASLGIDPVTYNDDLASAAKAWAEQLVDAGKLSHSPNRVHVGENVGYRSHHDDVDSTPLLIGAWIAEKKDFENGNYPDISTSGSVHDVGHYSQLIWSTTKEIGCAVVNGAGRDYMVCQYAPSGNRQGQPVY